MQRYYEHHSLRTQVLPANLKSIREIMQLAGVKHIAVTAPLLKELASTPVEAVEAIPSLFDEGSSDAPSEQQPAGLKMFGNNGSGYRTALMRNHTEAPARKLIEVISFGASVV